MGWRSGSGSGNGVFFAALLLFTLFLSTTASVDTLAAGQSINQTESLVSAEGRFRLGFFCPGESRRRYLGIWYNRITPMTVVWIANRRSSLPASSFGLLTLTENGTLVLTDIRGVVYWSTPALTEELRLPVARLKNSGNLAVDVRGRIVWQSFDYPGNTMLPGMMLGYDWATGFSRNFTSWRTREDPTPGDFTLAFDARGVPQVFLFNGTAPKWRPGPWVGHYFTGVPDMNEYNDFIYSYVLHSRSVSFKFDVWDGSTITRIVVQSWGVMEQFMWNNVTAEWHKVWDAPEGPGDRYNLCGPNSFCSVTGATCSCLSGFVPRWPLKWKEGITGGGCVRQVPLECGRRKDSFTILSRAKLPDASIASSVKGLGVNECKSECLRSCSCTAFATTGTGCVTWFGDLVDLAVYPPPNSESLLVDGRQDLYIRQPGTGPTDKKKLIVIIAISSTVLLLFLILGVGTRQMIGWRFSWEHYDQYSRINDVDLRIFRLSKISSATNNFSPENKVGEGGFGTVYKGQLDAENVAVKRLSRHSVQGLEEFMCETQLVAKLQHMNLVKLLGYCTESEEKILVYEYLPNQSLDKYIFAYLWTTDPERGRRLDWNLRFQIINGIAQGLMYLHHYSRLRVIHRDLKASNILLDDEWNPKISDFGLAKTLTACNNTQTNTNRIVGTHGYMSPEYAMKGLFSVKSDVFSFGVLLLEILSGKRNSRSHQLGVHLSLPGYAWSLWKEGNEVELLDATVRCTGPPSEMARCVQVALLCVQESPRDRPTMSDVVSMLSQETMGLREPKPPAFHIGEEAREDGQLKPDVCSNDVTMSTLTGR